MKWDKALHDKVGNTICKSINSGTPCPYQGFIRHKGTKFSPYKNRMVSEGNPLTASSKIVGPIGGYGWIVDFNKTSPRYIHFSKIEMDPASTLLISIPYPKGTTFTLVSTASSCSNRTEFTCSEGFTQVGTIEDVRSGRGNTYHVDSQGVITFRLAQPADQYTGNPTWSLPNYTTPAKHAKDVWALNRFERNGIRLPDNHYGSDYHLQAKCPGDNDSSPKNGYCSQNQYIYDPEVCVSGFVQVGYDKCCQESNLQRCMFADGSKNFQWQGLVRAAERGVK